MADPDASICDFAEKLLQRAKVRQEAVTGGNLPRAVQIKESLRTVVPSPSAPKSQTCLKEVQIPNIIIAPACPDPRAEGDVTKETKSGGRTTRLKSLTKKINSWEDNMTHYVPPTSRFNISPPKNSPRRSVTPAKRSPARSNASSSPPSPSSPKHVHFDPISVPRSPSPPKQLWMSASPPKQPLPKEASPPKQAPIRKDTTTVPPKAVVPPPQNKTSISAARGSTTAVPKFKVPASVGRKKDEVKNVKPQLNSTISTVGVSVAQRAKMFEQQSTGNVPKPYRAASRPFAHGKRGNPLPGLPGHGQVTAPKSHDITVSIPRGKVENQRRLFEGGQHEDLVEQDEGSSDMDMSADLSPSPPPPAFIPSPPRQQPVQEAEFSLTFSALLEDAEDDTLSPKSVSQTASSSSPRKDTLTLPAQSTTPKRAASPGRSRSSSPDKKKYPGARDVKRIRVNEPKPGKIYPSLTDIESETQTETEVEEAETEEEESQDEEGTIVSLASTCSSLGAEVARMAKANSNNGQEDAHPGTTLQTPRRNRHFRPTENFSLSASVACREIDALIDDALEGQSFSMIDTVMEDGFSSSVVASSTPVASILSGEGTVTLEAHAKVTTEEQEEEDSTLEEAIGGTKMDLGQSDSPRVHPGPEESIMFTQSPYVLDTNTPNKDSSPLETSSPLYPRRRGQSPAAGTPLLHTVSFFRKQQEQLYVTPRKGGQGSEKAVPRHLEEEDDEEPAAAVDHRTARVDAINDVIKKLEEEDAAQLRSIGQVSKALTLCKSTVEFSESTENVECEKVLLIACQKRNAILNEITRLRTEGALSSMPFFTASKNDLGPSCQGKLTISEITVELKPDFIRRHVTAGDFVHHFLILVKERHHVEASALVSVGEGRNNARVLDSDGCIHFPNAFNLEHLDPGFKAELEVFVLQTQKEFLPHETKYHILKKEFKGLVTPKKSKAESKFSRICQASPAGPDAVRTPNFSICGRLTLNISTLGRRGHGGFWNLDGVRFDSPVEGSISLKMQCSAEGGEEKSGFLTLFDDISGMGAWNRRWAKLTGNFLSFWMYPEDEQEGRFPLDQITLRNCVTTRVCPVQRDVCARANTFLLVTTRDPLPGDKDSLITCCHANKTAIRHLMSADTREERDAWCANMNRALANIRAWDPQAASPDDTLF